MKCNMLMHVTSVQNFMVFRHSISKNPHSPKFSMNSAVFQKPSQSQILSFLPTSRKLAWTSHTTILHHTKNLNFLVLFIFKMMFVLLISANAPTVKKAASGRTDVLELTLGNPKCVEEERSGLRASCTKLK